MAQDTISMAVIARIHTDFPTKFGVPRQSGLVEALEATVVFEPEYRIPEAVRGLEEFSHIWLIWQFSQSRGWSPTVRPPRLGGNRRLGVFATRSPFRPNPIGLSSVRLTGIERHPALGPVLHVAGADLVDGTPILDIKPYIPYGDCHPDAAGGFTDRTARQVRREGGKNETTCNCDYRGRPCRSGGGCLGGGCGSGGVCRRFAGAHLSTVSSFS